MIVANYNMEHSTGFLIFIFFLKDDKCYFDNVRQIYKLRYLKKEYIYIYE